MYLNNMYNNPILSVVLVLSHNQIIFLHINEFSIYFIIYILSKGKNSNNHFPMHSYNKNHFPMHSYNKNHFSMHSYNKNYFLMHSYSKNSFPMHSYNKNNFPMHSYNKNNFPMHSYSKNSFPMHSYSKNHVRLIDMNILMNISYQLPLTE